MERVNEIKNSGATKEEADGCNEPTLRQKAYRQFEKMANGAVEFWDKNKHWLKPVVTVIGIIGIIGIEERGKSRQRNEIAGLREELEMEREISNGFADRIIDLEDLIEAKDARHAAVASEDLRLGGRLGAQDLVELREYKKSQR